MPGITASVTIGMWLCATAALAQPSSNDAGVQDAAQASAAGKGPLHVGYAGSEPFVIGAGDSPRGLSITVFEEVARRLDTQVRFEPFPSIPSLLEAVASHAVDVGVGPISITADRAASVDFTQPYFSASVGILSPIDSSTWDRLRPLFSKAFGLGVLTLVLVLMGVGVLIWQAERRDNPTHFPRAALPGIANGMWFALVTMTTVGYGDRAPITLPGRVLSGVWMVLAMVAASSITAGIATALTLSLIDGGQISSLQDIEGKRVAVVSGTPADQLAKRHGAQRVRSKSLQDALDMVTDGHARAVLYDLPVLEHHLEAHPELALTAHETPVKADDYAFAVAIGSALRRPIDQVVLALREEGRVLELADDWLPEGQ